MAPDKNKKSKKQKKTSTEMSSSKDVKKLQEDYRKQYEKWLKHSQNCTYFANRAAELEQRMDQATAELDQLSSSSASAQRARGYGPTYDIGSGQHIMQQGSQTINLKREIDHLPNSIREFHQMAQEAKEKSEKAEAKVKDLEKRLEHLVKNPMSDLDNWHPMDGPEEDEDGGAAGSAYAGHSYVVQ
jgi:nitrogen-specific signal transduction histidine kinase